MAKADETPKKQRRPARTPRTGRPKKPVTVPHYTAHVRLTDELIASLDGEQSERRARGRADTIRAVLNEAFGHYSGVVRVLRIPILTFEEDRWLAREQLRLGCATRTDTVRAILDEARMRK